MTIKCLLSGPDIAHGHLAQYQYNGDGHSGKQFAEAIYECDDGYQLHNSKISSLYCQNGTWKGEMPRCIETKESRVIDDSERQWCKETNMGMCQQLCYLQGLSSCTK